MAKIFGFHSDHAKLGCNIGWLRGVAPLLFAAALLGACGGGGADQAQGKQQIASVQLSQGNGLSATVGRELATAQQVRVLDASGAPIAGQIVNFVVTLGGGSAFAGAAATDTNGYASERWTLGKQAGPQEMQVRAVNSAGVATVYATFNATAVADAPASVTVVSGAAQTGYLALVLAKPVQVQVADQYGNPTAGIAVTFADQSNGRVSPESATTDASGKAATNWTLGTALGEQTLRVAAGALSPIQVIANATNSGAYALTVVSGDIQTVIQHTAPAQKLTVKVTDSAGNPVTAVVLFTVTTANAYIDSNAVNVTTDRNGLASWQDAVHTAGQVQIRAFTQGDANQFTGGINATFTLNVAPAGSPFEGGFDMTASLSSDPNTPEIIPMLIRNGVVYPAGLPMIRGSVDTATGAVSIHRERGFGLGSYFDYIGFFTVQSNGSVTGSGTFIRHLDTGNPVDVPGTWTAVKTHD